MTTPQVGDDLTDLLAKLYEMQEDVGAKPKTSDEEKKNKAQTVAATPMGSNKKSMKKGSRFLELKSSVVHSLQAIHTKLKEVQTLENSGFGGNNPKEIIKLQAETREQTRQAQDEWKQMNQLYKNEARKKRSKFTQEELEVQATLVMRLKQEIEKIKNLQMKGYQRGDNESSLPGVPTQNISNFDVLSSNKPVTSWGKSGGSGGGSALSGGQQLELAQLEERDVNFDEQLDELGEGIQDLAEIAQLQGEEVKRQNVMLTDLEGKLDKVEESVTTMNSRMKETLDEVGRSSDKLCVDIMCIVLAIGFAAVFYKMAK